ncbi:MAG: tetratricopeptide repeat protein [Desulfobacterales bacterium]|nr:tetratricopeptide repeat protein [Desulfobacterales bacterium]MBF0395920.1 tetratricopeptide repeat protein [Desulfobacterales bacterium]
MSKILSVVVAISLLFFLSCVPKPKPPEAELDTPEHHVSNGNKLFDNGKIDDAFYEFNRAKELSPKYCLAYVGLGLVYGARGEYKKSLSSLEDADDYAKGNEEIVAVNIAYMRVYIMGEQKIHKNWLKEVESKFKKAAKLSPDNSAPYFYMGEAYKNSFEFSQATAQFKKVLDLNKDFVKEADKEYAAIQKIERAMPGSKVAQKIALLTSITRADVAALFIEELKVDELFTKRTPKNFDTSFKSPDRLNDSTNETNKLKANDIENHVLKVDIEAVIALGIKGLEPFSDGTFQPDKMINRAEFAMMIEDIIMKIKGDDSLSTKFIGESSPFPDLRSDLPYFNAVMVCTTRNIMETVNKSTGEFDPQALVSGADAMLSIRTLKSQL